MGFGVLGLGLWVSCRPRELPPPNLTQRQCLSIMGLHQGTGLRQTSETEGSEDVPSHLWRGLGMPERRKLPSCPKQPRHPNVSKERTGDSVYTMTPELNPDTLNPPRYTVERALCRVITALHLQTLNPKPEKQRCLFADSRSP